MSITKITCIKLSSLMSRAYLSLSYSQGKINYLSQVALCLWESFQENNRTAIGFRSKWKWNGCKFLLFEFFKLDFHIIFYEFCLNQVGHKLFSSTPHCLPLFLFIKSSCSSSWSISFTQSIKNSNPKKLTHLRVP